MVFERSLGYTNIRSGNVGLLSVIIRGSITISLEIAVR